MNRVLGYLVALAVTAASAFPQQAFQRAPSWPSSFVRWGAEIWSGSPSILALTRIDLDLNTTSRILIDLPPGNYHQLLPTPLPLSPRVPISPDGATAAIPIQTTGAGNFAVYVWRNIRAPIIGQSNGYPLPERDPFTSDPNIRIFGPPRFLNDQELWVLEGPDRPTRLARYHLGPTGAVALGASDLVDRQRPDPYIAYYDWLIYQGRAVVLQQEERVLGQGIEVLCYSIDGGVGRRFPVNPNGYAAYQVAFSGIRSVPAHPDWGFMQYSTGNSGRNQAQLIDLENGALTSELTVLSTEGRISKDGTLAHFREKDSDGSTLLPVLLPSTITQGQPWNTLGPIRNFFCSGSGGDSVATDGGYLVTAPTHGSCQGSWVHRTRIRAGQLEVVTRSTDSGNGPFQFQHGIYATFTDPGQHRLYNLAGASGHTLLNLNVPAMIHGTQSMTLNNVQVIF